MDSKSASWGLYYPPGLGAYEPHMGLAALKQPKGEQAEDREPLPALLRRVQPGQAVGHDDNHDNDNNNINNNTNHTHSNTNTITIKKHTTILILIIFILILIRIMLITITLILIHINTCS